MNAGHMDIRTVTVELLRAGPRHNQMVSPLTQYLGVCGNFAAGRVSLPYEDEQPRTLTHLRIVLSASELAMLPFEASKVPTGEDSMSTWLALQGRAPVCITRHIRSVSPEGIRWPSEPRLLFVAGPDTDPPQALHRKALADAMAPWRNADGPLGDRLVVLEKATLAHISREIVSAAANGTPF